MIEGRCAASGAGSCLRQIVDALAWAVLLAFLVMAFYLLFARGFGWWPFG